MSLRPETGVIGVDPVAEFRGVPGCAPSVDDPDVVWPRNTWPFALT